MTSDAKHAKVSSSQFRSSEIHRPGQREKHLFFCYLQPAPGKPIREAIHKS